MGTTSQPTRIQNHSYPGGLETNSLNPYRRSHMSMRSVSADSSSILPQSSTQSPCDVRRAPEGQGQSIHLERETTTILKC